MNIVYINGKYLSQKITGVQRYAREIVDIFDKDPSYKDYTFKVICPENAEIPSNKNRIEYIRLNKTGYYFEQITLPRYLKKNKAKILLNLCNLAPMSFPGSCVIHDMNLIDNKSFYSFKYRFIVGFIMKRNIKKYHPIFTVSEFSKNRLLDYFKLKENQIEVTYSGVKKEIDEIKDYNEKFPFSKGQFFLTVGSFNKTKNMGYIIETAKKRPEETFVITGGAGAIFQKNELEKPQNVIFTGYLEDDELHYLYSKCSAFIFPSFYEGFGAPPLEAIQYGCTRIILSNIDVFQEIYGNTASYCNPYDVESVLPLLDDSKVITEEEKEELLSKYQWTSVASVIFNGIKEQL